MDSVLFINKPYTWTSFDLVKKVKNILKHRFHTHIKVGHAGTLDPLATGLMILCTGKYTKSIQDYQNLHKRYTGVISLGHTTPSYDLETPFDADYPTEHITEENISTVAQSFIGTYEQTPPIYSAKKIQGKKLYDLARKGVSVDIPSNTVHIFDFNAIVHNTDIFFNIHCSKGTYIRSIAHDFGKKLQSGAYLKALRRIEIGKYAIDTALDINDV